MKLSGISQSCDTCEYFGPKCTIKVQSKMHDGVDRGIGGILTINAESNGTLEPRDAERVVYVNRQDVEGLIDSFEGCEGRTDAAPLMGFFPCDAMIDYRAIIAEENRPSRLVRFIRAYSNFSSKFGD